MPREHYLIFVPGLGDNNSLLNWAIKRFEKDGLIFNSKDNLFS